MSRNRRELLRTSDIFENHCGDQGGSVRITANPCGPLEFIEDQWKSIGFVWSISGYHLGSIAIMTDHRTSSGSLRIPGSREDPGAIIGRHCADQFDNCGSAEIIGNHWQVTGNQQGSVESIGNDYRSSTSNLEDKNN